jgi:hypothetical protein
MLARDHVITDVPHGDGRTETRFVNRGGFGTLLGALNATKNALKWKFLLRQRSAQGILLILQKYSTISCSCR